MSTPVPQPALFPTGTFSTEVLLIRHGRSADVVPGTAESFDPPLHAEGVAQAEALARRLDRKRIDAVYASDYSRATETAGYIAAPRGLDVTRMVELREVHLGDWEGGEFRRRASVADPEWVAWSQTGRWDGIPGGESDDALRSRVTAAVARLVADHEGGVIAVVCHGGVINAFLADLYGSHRSFCSVIENTSVTLVRFGGPRPTVITVNDCSHLYDPVLGGAVS
jgi:probable phosphoglycerate mutase